LICIAKAPASKPGPLYPPGEGRLAVTE